MVLMARTMSTSFVTVPVRLNFVMVTLAVRFPVNYSTRPPIGARQLMFNLTFTTMLQKTSMLGVLRCDIGLGIGEFVGEVDCRD